ncbi:hypothetical protein C8R47DRAFT_1172841 [Mycena vitilis]|nr:hypothetical protein C8R47DRAFT_1172841 [Mycena vitilis]
MRKRHLPTDTDSSSSRFTYWRDHHDWLKESGYLLRPRYRPGWIPSWQNDPHKVPSLCEDAWSPSHRACLDAVCDGSRVMLKKRQSRLSLLLRDGGPSGNDHCVPILHALYPPDDDNVIILVRPLIRWYDNPRFDTIGEVVEFFRQIFEGLQFMHQNHAAHRSRNRLHSPKLKPNSYSRATNYTRTRLPVKYYFIDFGLSRQYDPTKGPPFLEDVIRGGDKSVPEFAIPGNFSCDPFPTDIYYLANLIRRHFLLGFPELDLPGKRGFEFMWPLVTAMRPDIDQVVGDFADIQKGLSSWKLRSRVILQNQFPYLPHRIVAHWYRRIRSIILRIPAIPVPT